MLGDFEIIREHCKGKAAHKVHGCTAPKKSKRKKIAVAKRKPKFIR